MEGPGLGMRRVRGWECGGSSVGNVEGPGLGM